MRRRRQSEASAATAIPGSAEQKNGHTAYDGLTGLGVEPAQEMYELHSPGIGYHELHSPHIGHST
jgi:hypothetical protein